MAHRVSEAAVKPAGKLSLDASTLPVLKLAALVVVTRDLLKLSTAEAGTNPRRPAAGRG
ncbi:MAG TPA: hypothetical protein VMM36_07555 [Opitutaceae bacterium]|nr:hypothetical protein [Opitutaceae bacterium]